MPCKYCGHDKAVHTYVNGFLPKCERPCMYQKFTAYCNCKNYVSDGMDVTEAGF